MPPRPSNHLRRLDGCSDPTQKPECKPKDEPEQRHQPYHSSRVQKACPFAAKGEQCHIFESQSYGGGLGAEHARDHSRTQPTPTPTPALPPLPCWQPIRLHAL